MTLRTNFLTLSYLIIVTHSLQPLIASKGRGEIFFLEKEEFDSILTQSS